MYRPCDAAGDLLSRRQFLRAGIGLTGLGIVSLAAACAPAAPAAAPTVAPPTSVASAATPASVAEPTIAPAPPTAAAVVPTTAPAQTPGSAGAAASGTLVATASGDLQFDPYFAQTRAWFVQGQVFSALFDYQGKDPFSPSGQLAESWEDAEKTLTVKLRSGVKFHNGRPLTAQDVVDNIERAKDKSIGHYLFDYFDPTVDGAEALDPSTVRITYKQAYPLKLDDLTLLYLIPKEAMADIATKPVGSGPFRFVNYAPGDKLDLQRFDLYWDAGKPHLAGIQDKIIPDPQGRIANLSAGSADFVDSVSPSDVVRLKTDGNVQVITPPPGGFWYTNVLNTARPPFDNKQVRQALNWSVDREKIAKLAYFGLAPATQSRYLPDAPWYNQAANTMYSFDLQKSKALLAAAGFPNGFQTSMSLTEATMPGSKAMAQVWAQDLAQIGVQLSIIEQEDSAFWDAYGKGDWDMVAFGLGDGRLDPASAINNSSPLRLTNNRSHVETQPFFAEYSKLVTDGIASTDPRVRKPIYDRIQMIWADESWTINLAFWVIPVLLSNRVKNYRHPVDQVPHFADISIQG